MAAGAAAGAAATAAAAAAETAAAVAVAAAATAAAVAAAARQHAPTATAGTSTFSNDGIIINDNTTSVQSSTMFCAAWLMYHR